MNLSKFRPYLTWNTLWLALFTIGFAFFLCGMPKMNDDYYFMAYLRPWFEKQDVIALDEGGNIFKAGIPCEELWKVYVFRYNVDNVRLTNILGTFLLLFPKWFGSGLVTIMLVWMVILVFKIAGVDWRKSALMVPVLFMATFMLPWIDNLGSLIFQMNYVFPSWLSLLLIRAILRHDDSGRHDVRSRSLIYLLSFLVGASHEGFSIPMMAGFAVLMIMSPRWRKPQVWVSILIMAVMTVWLLSCPGMRTRMSAQVIEQDMVTVREILEFMVKCYHAFVLMLILWIWTLLGKSREIAMSVQVILPLTIATTCLFLNVSTHAGIRMAFLTEWCSFIIIVHILHLLPKPAIWRKIAFRRSVVALLLLPTFIFITANAWFSVRYAQSVKKTVAAYVSDPKASVFSEPPIKGWMSPLCDYYYFIQALPFIRQYYESLPWNIRNCVWMVPADLEYATPENSERLGNGFYKKGRFYFVPEDSVPHDYRFVYLDVDYGQGEKVVQGVSTGYRSKGDHKKYFWIMTRERFHGLWTNKIKTIKFHPAEQ